MYKNNLKIILFSIGSGKTALAKRLAKKFGFVYVSTNEIIKDVIAKKMKLSKMVSELVVKGELGK